MIPRGGVGLRSGLLIVMVLLPGVALILASLDLAVLILAGLGLVSVVLAGLGILGLGPEALGATGLGMSGLGLEPVVLVWEVTVALGLVDLLVLVGEAGVVGADDVGLFAERVMIVPFDDGNFVVLFALVVLFDRDIVLRLVLVKGGLGGGLTINSRTTVGLSLVEAVDAFCTSFSVILRIFIEFTIVYSS